MRASATKITRFFSGKHLIDIVETKTNFEAWITRTGFGVSYLMFGIPKRQTDRKSEISFDEFLEIVKENLQRKPQAKLK